MQGAFGGSRDATDPHAVAEYPYKERHREAFRSGLPEKGDDDDDDDDDDGRTARTEFARTDGVPPIDVCTHRHYFNEHNR